jgi:hypothetical protein
VSACRKLQVEGVRGKMIDRTSWSECVKNDMKEFGLKKEDAQDRVIWKGLTYGKRLTPPKCSNEEVSLSVYVLVT